MITFGGDMAFDFNKFKDEFNKIRRRKDSSKREELEAKEPTKGDNNDPSNTDTMYDGIVYEGGFLKKVYDSNICDGEFIIPPFITEIGNFAFSRLENLRRVVFHSGVENIQHLAFSCCTNLEEVCGLEKADKIRNFGGFPSCIKLKSIAIPPNAEMIGMSAFEDCVSLKDIIIPQSVIAINFRAFMGCENLRDIVIPQGVEFITKSAFSGCKNLKIHIIEGDEKYCEDVLKEQGDEAYTHGMFADDNIDGNDDDYSDGICEQPHIPTNEEQAELFEEMGIKYRKTIFNGEEIFWLPERVRIGECAFHNVKQVVVSHPDTFNRVLKSGYSGMISYYDKDSSKLVDINLSDIKKLHGKDDLER